MFGLSHTDQSILNKEVSDILFLNTHVFCQKSRQNNLEVLTH